MKCGLLVNNIGYYIPFIQWFYQLHLSSKINIVVILCNSEEFIANNLPNYKNLILIDSDFSDLTTNCEIVFSLGYWKKIPIDDINKIKYGVINVHNSYKLKYRGRHMSYWAIINNEKIFGTTIHYMNENIDDGDIIDTECFSITDEDTSYTLTCKANKIALDLLKKNINTILSQKINSKIKKEENYYFYKEKDLSHEIPSIYLTDSKRLIRYVRALTYPDKAKPYMVVDNKKIFLSL